MTGASDPRVLLLVCRGVLAKSAILDSTDIRESKMTLFAIVLSRLVLAVGCM